MSDDSDFEDDSVSEDADDDFEVEEEKKSSKGKKAGKDSDSEEEKGSKKKKAAPKKPAAEKKKTPSKKTTASAPAAKKGKDDKVKALSDGPAEHAVLDYLNKQNRPYSAQNVFDNLHGVVKKAQAQKLLESLASKGKLQMKEYGKAKIFLAAQDQYPDVDESELAEMDTQLNTLKATAQELTEEVRSLTNEHKSIMSQLTNEELEEQLKKYAEENEKLQVRLVKLRDGAVKVTDEERETAEKKHKLFHVEWRKRKRICRDMVNTIADGADMKPTQLMSDMGVETDEDMGVTMPAVF